MNYYKRVSVLQSRCHCGIGEDIKIGSQFEYFKEEKLIKCGICWMSEKLHSSSQVVSDVFVSYDVHWHYIALGHTNDQLEEGVTCTRKIHLYTV